MTPLEKERLDTLAGARSRQAIGKAAVRIEDLDGILQLPGRLLSAPAAGAPSQAEFNALVDDVTMLFNRLTAVVQALQARKL